ncbi:hypothetical protein FQN57_007126 [Myotisia sp. PD_48]|nr:hypothetical protein FQN57_007126 [Myotisia sp. PD_48]
METGSSKPDNSALSNVRNLQTLNPEGACPNGSWENDKNDNWDQFRFWGKTNTWLETFFKPEYIQQIDLMSHLRARPKAKGNSRLAPALIGGQKSRDRKSAQYRNLIYETVLASKGSFMHKSSAGITDTSKALCKDLLESKQPIPEGTNFRDATFEEACQRPQNKNESRVIKDIAQLIIPSAEDLALNGADRLDKLVESTNESWRSCIAVHGTLPHPDYAVGFGRTAFTDTQLEKLAPFIGDIQDSCSYFLATFYMYFPFLTCEVKCGASALNIADRQNAHNMTVAVRAIVELFRWLGREEEVNREILAFSISHDNTFVRIYGHYHVIEEGGKTTFYRHPIKKFGFISDNGKEKWTAYRFTRNVYDKWMPGHLQRIRSAIDDIPIGVDLNTLLPSDMEQDDSGVAQTRSVTQDTSFTPDPNPTNTSKRQRKR